MSMIPAKIPILLLACCFIWACNSSPSNREEAAASQDSLASASLEGIKDAVEVTEPDLPEGAERRMVANDDVNFSQSFPLLHSLIAHDPALTAQMEIYARNVLMGSDISSEAEIISLCEQRKDEIIPALNPLFDNIDLGEFFEKASAYYDELIQLGISIATIEGNFASLIPAPMLESQVAAYGTESFTLYLNFIYAEAQSIGGEYPYSDMEPFREMILTGEKMMTDHSESPYYQEVSDRFRNALLTFTGIYHQMEGSYSLPMVGFPIQANEFGITELETHALFVQENTDSRYYPVVKSMLERLSSSSPRPENLYLLVADWAEDEEAAQKKHLQYLDDGKSILHHFPVTLGDGSSKIALIYRFFEDADLANRSFEEQGTQWDNLQALMVSLRNDQLFQLGI